MHTVGAVDSVFRDGARDDVGAPMVGFVTSVCSTESIIGDEKPCRLSYLRIDKGGGEEGGKEGEDGGGGHHNLLKRDRGASYATAMR